MQLDIVEADIRTLETDALVVNLFEGKHEPTGASGAVDAALDGALGDLITVGDVTGRLGETTVLYPRGALPAKRVVVTGLGPESTFGDEAARKAAAAALQRARTLGADTMATIVHGAGVGGLDPERAAQATIEGSLLAAYRFEGWKHDDAPHAITRLVIAEADPARAEAVRRGAAVAEAVARGVALARDLVNRPPNVADPAHLATTARSIADRHRLQVEVGDRDWAEEHAMGAFLAVAQGTRKEPAFIVLEHNAQPTADLPTVVLVGKGVTFDSGGLSLKTRDGMIPMKSDMGGAAAVLGAMEAVAALDLPLHLVGICPCVENMPDGAAYRPSDVLVASNGVSIEVLSTDAEGRLALADALVYAQRYEPDAVIDLATLTGSCVVALGKGVAAGVFANDDALSERLQSAGAETNERVWRLPLYDDYRTTIDSKVADIQNSGGRDGGVGTSAAFLKEFVDYRWAHLDIAGMVLTDRGDGYRPAGATGFGVRLLVEALRNW